jgi:hypothetical protein
MVPMAGVDSEVGRHDVKTRPPRFVTAILAGLILAIGHNALAQPTAGTPTQGPLVLSPIQSAIVFSPDVKVTTVNDKTSTLVGGYAGKLIEQRVLIGGGVYVLADPRDDAHLVYGGLVAGWRLYGSGRLNANALVLAGPGQATLFASFSPSPDPRQGRRLEANTVAGRRFDVRSDFVVAEPQLNVQIGVTTAIHFNLGASYRFTSAPDYFNDRLRGASGSVGIQFDLGQ